MPFYNGWNWGPNRLTVKPLMGPGFIPSLSAYDLDSGAQIAPCLVQAHTGKEAIAMMWWASWPYGLHLQSWTKDLVFPRGLPLSAWVCSPCPLVTLAHTENLPTAKCRKEDYFPQKVQTEKKLAETWTKGRVGRWQKRIKLKPEAFWVLSILPSLLLRLLSFIHSFSGIWVLDWSCSNRGAGGKL